MRKFRFTRKSLLVCKSSIFFDSYRTTVRKLSILTSRLKNSLLGRLSLQAKRFEKTIRPPEASRLLNLSKPWTFNH